MFSEALWAVRRFPASAFEPYKLTFDQVEALCARLLAWADEIEAASRWDATERLSVLDSSDNWPEGNRD